MSATFVIHDPRWKTLLTKERALFRLLIKRALKTAGLDKAELSVVFTSDKEIRDLNAQYRKIDKATNVLSFPLIEDFSTLEEGIELGDVVLAFETVKKECAAQKKTLRAHTAHLITHGTLHLLGHDHMNDADASEMEAIEIALLGGVKIKNPY